MAMNKASLKGRIIAELEAVGVVTSGDHAWGEKLAEALANAVVDEVQQNAKAVINSGSSSGQHPVQ